MRSLGLYMGSSTFKLGLKRLIASIVLAGILFLNFGMDQIPLVNGQGNAAHGPIVLISGTVEAAPEIHDAVVAALETTGINIGEAQYYAITDISEMGRRQFISVVGLKNVAPDLKWVLDDNAVWAGLVLLENQNHQWNGSVEGSEEFSQMLQRIPDDILSTTAKSDLDPTQRVLKGQAGYHFPWASGTSMKYGTEAVHDNGFAGVVSGWKAVDFLSGYGTSGEAPNDLRAAAAGTVNYKCTPKNGGVTTAIKVNDLFYTHLMDNSSISVGKSYSDGQSIGTLKTGSFNENCGYASQGTNTFHVHLGFPNTGSVVFDDWTLSISDGIWRKGGESRGVNSWFQSGSGGSSSCPAPTLNNPGDGYISTSQTITFSWSAISGCSFNGYTFRIKDTSDMESGGNTIRDTGVGTTSWTETIATQFNNRDLYWGVRAANATSAAWRIWRFRIEPGSGPNTPSSPSPSDGAALSRTNNTNLSWNTNGSNCTVHVWGGSIDISPSGGCSSLSLGQQRGGSYSWQVAASNNYGNSTGPTWHFYIKPYGPTGLNTSTASSSQINLGWTVSSDDDGTNIDGYNVYRNDQAVAYVNKGVNSYQSTGLVCNTPYTFYVKSVRQGIESDSSNTASSTTSVCGPGTPVLNSPANNAVLGRADNVILSWNTASGANSYRAHFWNGSNIDLYTNWSSGTSTSLGSQWGGAYQWNVEASNGSISSYSETRTVTVLVGTPSGLSATIISPTQVNLSWNASADAPGNIDGYQIYKDGAYLASVGSSTTAFSDSGVACGNAYSYYVVAIKGSIVSSQSNSASAWSSGCPPAAPNNLTISAATTTSLSLNWQDNSNNENGFHIYRWDYDGSQWTFIYFDTVNSNVTSYTQTNLPCGNDFNFYEVSAFNDNGESDLTAWVQGATSTCPLPELSVTTISFYPVSPYANDTIWAGIEIQNNSDSSAPAFWIDLYIDDAPTGCNDWGNYYVRANPMPANSTQKYYITLPPSSLAAGDHQIRAFIDSGCSVTEGNDNDNVSSPSLLSVANPAFSPPDHDNFNSAKPASAFPFTDVVNVMGATTDADDPAVPACNLGPGMTSVWYQYTPSQNTSLILDTFGSNFDTFIAVWSGSRGNLALAGCNDDFDFANKNYQSLVDVNLQAGTTYYFEVAQFSTSYSMGMAALSSEMVKLSAPSPYPQKPVSDVGAQAGGTLQFHVIKKIFKVYLPTLNK
jgi:hypothetical protein